MIGLAEKEGQQQQDLLTQQTWANRANQNTLGGSLTWDAQQSIDPATGKPITSWTQNTTYDPQLEASIKSGWGLNTGRNQLGQSMLGNLGGQLGQPIDTSGMAGFATGPQAGNLSAITNPYGFGVNPQNIDTSRMGASGDYAQRAGDAMYQQATSRLDPQWQQRSNDFKTQLLNQGHTAGSEPYEKAMAEFNRSKNDAYQQANFGAITGAGSEAARMFGMDQGARDQQLAAQNAMFGQQLQSGQFGLYGENQAFGQQQQAGAQNFQQQQQAAAFQNQLRNQQLMEMFGIRNQGLGEFNQLLSGSNSQLPQFGNYGQAGQGQAFDLTGAAGTNYQNQMDANAARNQQTWGTIGSIGMAAATAY
jgi:hypothetical protein